MTSENTACDGPCKGLFCPGAKMYHKKALKVLSLTKFAPSTKKKCAGVKFWERTSLQAVVRDWWPLYLEGCIQGVTHGPFGKLLDLVHSLGLDLDSTGRLFVTESCSINVLECSQALLKRVLLDQFSQAAARELKSRAGFEDIQGVDVNLVTWRDRAYSPTDVAKLMRIRDGSFFTNSEKCKFDVTKSNFCAWCGEPDTLYHRYTTCCRYDSIRSAHQELFSLWPSWPYAFQRYGLAPNNPWDKLLWEAFGALEDRLRVYQFQPRGDCIHVYTDGSCWSPTCTHDSLASWATVVAGIGALSWGQLRGLEQCILRAELTAALSAILWARCWTGVLNLWIDNQTVVDHLRDLLRGVADWKMWEHSDLWQQVDEVLRQSTAEIVVHKVASHLEAEDCFGPIEDFARYWNSVADKQAGVANLCRPSFFMKVWIKYQAFRQRWKHHVGLLTKFQLAIANTDCNSETSFDDGPEPTEVSHFDFVRHDNTSEVCVLAVPDLFSHDQDARFQTVTLALLQWLSIQDREAASMRLVGLVEVYVGFRIFGYHKRPLSLGSDLQGPLSVVTFAADFRYFKKCFRWLCDRAMIPWKSGMVDLSEILIFTPQPAIMLGWKGEVESTVLSALSDFIGHRPIRTAQGFSKPWHI